MRKLAFLACGDFHARSRFARSTIPKGKWVLPREDKGDREGILRTHPIPQVIRLELFLRPQIPRGDWTTANHIAQMCSAWMTHAQSHASFTKLRQKKMTEDAESDIAIRFVDENERFLLKLCQRNEN